MRRQKHTIHEMRRKRRKTETRKGLVVVRCPCKSRTTFSFLRGARTAYISTRQYQEAASWFRKMIDSGVYVPGSYSWLAQVYAAEGRMDRAVEADLRYRVASGANPAAIDALKNAFAMSGWKGYLRKLLEQRIGNQGYVEPYVFATIYARLGEKGQALAWLEKSVRDRSLFMTRLNTDPTFDDLHTEPRFQALVRRVGLFNKPPQS